MGVQAAKCTEKGRVVGRWEGKAGRISGQLSVPGVEAAAGLSA